nr:hypothetical protein BCU64_21625 [Vibrio lentus]
MLIIFGNGKSLYEMSNFAGTAQITQRSFGADNFHFIGCLFNLEYILGFVEWLLFFSLNINYNAIFIY